MPKLLSFLAFLGYQDSDAKNNIQHFSIEQSSSKKRDVARAFDEIFPARGYGEL